MSECNSTRASTPKQARQKQSRYTTELFIERATEVHGKRYDYSKSIYTAALSKLIITCLKHGDFEQAASKHWIGRGCPKCAREALRKTTKQFIAESIEVHGDKYSYKKSRYIDNTKRMVITCKGCGKDFRQTSQTHLAGKGCPNCNKGCVRKTTEQFIAEARATHGDRYDYRRVVYERNIKPVIIGCKEHGYFKQAPWNHVKGHGCYECGLQVLGFSKDHFQIQCNKNNNGNGYLYVLRCSSGSELFYKIGITSRGVEQRFSSVTIMPYDYDVEYLIEDRGEFIYDLESRLHSLLKADRHKPSISFAGETECFTNITLIERLIRGLQGTEQLQLLA